MKRWHRVVVADRHDGVASDQLLAPRRERHLARRRHLRAHEALVHREAEDERKAGRKAALELVQHRKDPLVEQRLVLLRLGVGLGRRLLRELRDVVRPGVLGADAELGDALHPVADHRAAVGVDRPLHRALVVVDEQARGHEVLVALLGEVELEGRADRVRRAAAELALVVHRRHLRREVDLLRQRRQHRLRRREHVVPGIGQVGNPPEALHGPGAKAPVDRVAHFVPPDLVASAAAATLTVKA